MMRRQRLGSQRFARGPEVPGGSQVVSLVSIVRLFGQSCGIGDQNALNSEGHKKMNHSLTYAIVQSVTRRVLIGGISVHMGTFGDYTNNFIH